jgi:hypothetical protein
MGKRKARVVDESTGEDLGEVEITAASDVLDFPRKPMFETPEAAIKAIRNQRITCDRLDEEAESAKAQAKAAKLSLDTEESVLRRMLRELGQLKLFGALLLLSLGLAACSPAAADQDPLGPGAPGGWDDLKTRADDFVLIEPGTAPNTGVAVLFDTRHSKAWVVVGQPSGQHLGLDGQVSAKSWNALAPIDW